MVEEVAVDDLVHPAPAEEKADMLAQQCIMLEGGGELRHELRLAGRQCGGIIGVYGGEAGLQHLIGFAIHCHCAVLEIHLGQKDAVCHAIFRVALEELSLQLELQHRHGLVHLGGEACIDGIVFVLVQDMRGKALTGIVAVDLGGKHGQGA